MDRFPYEIIGLAFLLSFSQAFNPNDRIMINCSDFEVGLKIISCMDDTLAVSTAPLPNVYVPKLIYRV